MSYVRPSRTLPILMNDISIHGLQAGRKTMTRRLVHPSSEAVRGLLYNHWPDEYVLDPANRPLCESASRWRVGDRLWVRECFSYTTAPAEPDEEHQGVWYWADGEPVLGDYSKPKPSIHMPRWASRFTLDVLHMHLERLNAISEADAIAEGIEMLPYDGNAPEFRGAIGWKSYEIIHRGRGRGKPHPHASIPNKSPITSYREIWESMQGPGSWDENPWVVVTEFESTAENIDERTGEACRAIPPVQS